MRSISSLRAVSMMIGVSLVARSRRVISSPSTWGSIRSSTTRSNVWRANASSAAWPSAAVVTS